MDEVYTNTEDSEVSKIILLFPEVFLQDVRQSKGDIELLIGADCCDLLPNMVAIIVSDPVENRIMLLFRYTLRMARHCNSTTCDQVKTNF